MKSFEAIRRTIYGGVAKLGFGLASYRQPSRSGRLEHILRVGRKRSLMLTPVEADQLMSLVRATAKLGGSMAEVGVYLGSSARLIRESDGNRPLHLFDTFEGLPPTAASDVAHNHGQYKPGEYACSLDDVRNYLLDCGDLHFHKGTFPSTGAEVSQEIFSFVHSDVDIYESTKAVLEFFYPRMVRGGIILSHDFACAPNIARAFAEFFADRPEPIVELSGDQAMIVKL